MIEIKETDKAFSDSPDVGEPNCLCSRCGILIKEKEVPIRILDEENNLEI